MNIRKCSILRFLLFLTPVFVFLTIFDYVESSEVNFYVDLDLVEPTPLLIVPGTNVYYIFYYDEPIYFYSGYWYRLYDGRWHRAISHRGPWRYIHQGYVPNIIINIPVHFHYKYRYHDKKWHNFRRIEHWKHNERHYRYH